MGDQLPDFDPTQSPTRDVPREGGDPIEVTIEHPPAPPTPDPELDQFFSDLQNEQANPPAAESSPEGSESSGSESSGSESSGSDSVDSNEFEDVDLTDIVDPLT